MNEQNSLSERDIETLQRVDALVASPQAGPDGASDVAVLLANTVPQADRAFQSRLEAQLLAKLDGERTHKAREDNLARPRNTAPATIFKRILPTSNAPLGRAAGRLGSALVGAAMVAALVLAIAFLVQSRRDNPVISTQGTATANALATLTASSSDPTPAYPITIRTSLLPVSVNAWSPDTRSSTSTVAWSGDGRTLASAAPDGIVTFWNAFTGEKLHAIDTSATGSLRGIEWSPDGTILATYSDRESSGWGFIDLWDPNTGEKLHSFTEQQGRITSMDWSPNSTVLAWTDGWNITLWDRVTESHIPKPQPTWPALITTAGIEPNLTTNLAWSPDGTGLATSQSNIVKIWNPKSGQELAALTHNGPITRIDWANDGSRLAVLVAGDPTQVGGPKSSLVLWDTASNRQVDTPVVEGSVTSIDWLPHGLVLAISIVDDRTAIDYVARYDVITGQVTRITDVIATEVAWSPDNQTLAIANSGEGIITLRNAWTQPVPQPTATTIGPLPTGAATATLDLTMYPDGGCWGGWGVSIRTDKVVAGAKSGSTMSLRDIATTVSADGKDLWAVGSARDSVGLARTLILRWNGPQWSVVPSPNKSEQYGYQGLNAVVGLSNNDVWAVGDFTSSNAAPQETLIEHWDGIEWSIIRSPSPGVSNSLLAIDAASSNDIWAVGYTLDANGGGMKTLMLHWDGQAWSVVPSPNLEIPSGLQSVAAISADDAWVVGWTHSDSPGTASIALSMPLAMHWNGTRWSTVPIPGLENAQLTGVSASPKGDVWATGYRATEGTGTEAVVLRWEQTRWSMAQSPGLKGDSNDFPEYEIEAISSEDVWIAGSEVAHWDGQQWTTQNNTNAQQTDPDLRDVVLSGISVPWKDEIWAVGAHGVDPPQPIILSNASSSPCKPLIRTPVVSTPLVDVTPSPTAVEDCAPVWTIIDSPNPSINEEFGHNALSAVAVLAPDNVWAVGLFNPSSDRSPEGLANIGGALTTRWDGKEWTLISDQNSGGLAIAAISPDDIWTLRGYWNIAHWDGTRWNPVEASESGKAILQGITALSTNDVWAVGYSEAEGGTRTHIERWDGKQWRVIPSPNVAPEVLTGTNQLKAVAALSANDVWAVGNYSDRDKQLRTLMVHWDGTDWRVVPSPSMDGDNRLYAIEAVSTNDVWAVGSYGVLGSEQTLTLHWDGAKWSVVRSPDVGDSSVLMDIAAVSANDVWAVGYSSEAEKSEDPPVILHWDGSRWEVSTSIAPTGMIFNSLYGVTALPSGEVWAVGWAASRPGAIKALVLRYAKSLCETPTATALGVP